MGDLYGSNSVLNLCYGLEWTGICTHFAWMLIGILRKTLFRSELPPKEVSKEMNTQEKAIDYFKYLLSFSVLSTYFVFLMYGMWTGEALLSQSGVVAPVVFICFALCILFLALLEGLQVGILVR